MEIVLSDKQLGAKRTEGYRNAFAKESVLGSSDKPGGIFFGSR